jgi:hypothetical protein
VEKREYHLTGESYTRCSNSTYTEALFIYRNRISNSLQYLDSFSKALVSEVLVLIGEVGGLREERRAAQ